MKSLVSSLRRHARISIPKSRCSCRRQTADHADVIANGQWQNAVQAYLATISFADAQIGRVLDALDKSEHADNAVIVLWGDHGWHLGEKEHWRKHALWHVSTRTPLIFVLPRVSGAPSGVAKDQLCQRPVSLIDIYPTLIDLCGLPKREGLDGHSLQPLLIIRRRNGIARS